MTSRIYRPWTHTELQALHQHYPLSHMAVIRAAIPTRTQGQIWGQARHLGLRRMFPGADRVTYDTSRLLLDTPETLYWIGFLLADGHFSDDNGINVTLAILDLDHLSRFAAFLSHRPPKVYGNKAELRTHDARYAGRIRVKYGVVHNKTYNPPPLHIYQALPDDLFLALVIGFNDGDGTAVARSRSGGRSAHGGIVNHATWLSFQAMIAERLTLITGAPVKPPRLDRAGYSRLGLYHRVLKALRLAAIRMNLPVLERKWKQVDTSFVTRNEKTIQYLTDVERLYGEGLHKAEIAVKLGLTPYAVKALWQRIRWSKGPKGTATHQCVAWDDWTMGNQRKCRICSRYLPLPVPKGRL